MGAVTIQQMADRVAALMEERLGIKGQGLAEKLRKGGHALPRKVRDAADHLAESAHMSQSPKLMLQVNEETVAEAYDVCVKHLGSRRRSRGGGFLGNLAVAVGFSVLAAAVLVVGVLYLRGYL